MLILKATILWRCMCKTWCKCIHIHEREANRRSSKSGTWMNMLKKGEKIKETKEGASAQSAWKYLPVWNFSEGLCLHSSASRVGSWESPCALLESRQCGVLHPAAGLLKAGWAGTPRGRLFPSSLRSEAAEYAAFLKHKIQASRLCEGLDPTLANGLNWLCRSWGSTYVRH